MPEDHGYQDHLTGIDEAHLLPAAVEAMLAEQEQIRRALVANGGNITKTARQLGLTRRSLYRRLEKYGFRQQKWNSFHYVLD